MSKISELSDGGSIQSGDTLIAVRSGGNVKVTYGGTTTANIDGGTIDGTVIGGSSAAAGTFTTLTATSANVNGTVTSTGILEASDGTNGEMQFGLGTALTTGAGTYDSSVRWNGSGGNLLFSQGAVEKMRIGASGIDVTGTVTADGLTVDGSTVISGTGPNLTLSETDTTDVNTYLNNGGGSFNIQTVNDAGNSFTKRFTAQHSTGDISFYDSAGSSQSFYWDASAESLGIGTTSPSGLLHIKSTSGNAQLYVQTGDTTSKSQLIFGDSGDSNTGGVQYDHSDDSLQFHVGNIGEKVRIDASGNLLVGKTASNSSVAGCELLPSGIGALTANGNQALYLNRLTSDGAIVEFRKDGTNVGSIGAFGGDLTLGTGITGIHFKDASDAIIPYNVSTGADRSGDIDLGLANNRFKNLYLSGGVYLGGTGAANKLDDYEQGTFTAVISDGTNTVSMGSQKYTKVGRVVTFILSYYNLDTSSLSGNVKITGLPFASDPDTSQSASLYYRDGGTSAESIIGFINPNATEMIIRENRGSATAVTNVSATAAVTVFATVTYTAV